MKLQELAVTRPTKQISKVFESYFEQRIQFDKLNRAQTANMLSKVRGLVKEHRSSASFHTSERDPSYLKLMMMEQALTQRIREEDAMMAIDVNDPKVKTAMDKVKRKQTLTPDEQKMVGAIATLKTENNTGGFLKESEVQQAQVVLAAQDMVDRMQKMLEDTTEMQFKELPALVDSIKNQVGVDQAAQFNTDASAALAGLVQNLQGAKQQLENALGVVTGQNTAPVVPGVDDAAGLGAEELPPVPGEEEVDIDIDAEVEPEMEPSKVLGRERR
jgi:hypothetical protein